MYLLRLFGGISIDGLDDAVETGLQHRSLAVLALLAVARDKGCSRDKLIGYLWSESDQNRARHRLSDTVSMLRKSLGDEAMVLAAGGVLRLNLDVVESDAGAFLAALDAGELETAAELYEGPFLDGFYTSGAPEFERWVELERQRFADAYAGTLERLAEQAEAGGEHRRAVEWWKRLLGLDPYNSRYALGLMEAMARSGDPANAIQVAHEHERLLKEELDAEPVPEVLELAERLRREAGEFVEAVERPRTTTVGRESAAELRVGPGRGRLAVLPFVNVADDPKREYFADGITGEIINHLGQVADLKVISRTSVMQYKDTAKNLPQIAEELGVATVVEGEVLQIGDRVRISAQLIDAATDTHLWADRYERHLADIIEVQSDIAKRIVAALQLTLTPEARDRIERKPTENLEAYDYYLLGRHHFDHRNAENLRRAIRFFEAAIERDATFALAWTGLANAWIAVPFFEPVPSSEAYGRTREAARRALELDEGLAEGHALLGALAIHDEWDWNRAETHLQRAVELNPSCADAHHWLGLAQRGLGQLDRAVQSMQRGIDLNPLAYSLYYSLALPLYEAGRVDEALAVFRKAEQFEPPVGWGLQFMSVFLAHQRRPEEASRIMRKWGEVVGYPDPERLHVVLKAFDDSEFTREALAVLEDVEATTGLRAGDLSGFYMNLDAPAQVLKVVRETIAQRHPYVLWFGKSVWTRGRLLESPEIMAELRAAGVRIYDWTPGD
jgi:DNA-binding SARP family transcriptional activator/Tfp pilus assembly protein PilF